MLEYPGIRIRPVFDASAQGYNGVALNDYLETGPNLFSNMAAILYIRFRRWRFSITTDITKAFLQIAVTELDQDTHRFLWDDQGIIRVVKFLLVTDVTPFLLNVIVHYHMSTIHVPQLSQTISPIFM